MLAGGETNLGCFLVVVFGAFVLVLMLSALTKQSRNVQASQNRLTALQARYSDYVECRCANCAGINPPKARFCGQCGEPVSPAVLP